MFIIIKIKFLEVVMSYSDIRAKARQNLGNNIFSNTWLLALVVTVIVSACLGIASSTVIVPLIITGPLMVGTAGIMLSLNRGSSDVKLEKTFSGFSTDNLGENILLGLISSLFIFLWSLLFVIPGIVKSYSYSMIYFIKNDHPEYTWKQCLDESRRIMDGNKARLFVLDLTFIGWWIVGSICFGIGTLWVSTYVNEAHAVFYDEIKNKI